MRKIIIENLKKETSLSKYMLLKFPNLSKGSLYKALRNKDIKVNEKRINKDVILNSNDKLEIYISDNILFNLPKSINYIYEDKNIAVVFKPQGILSNNEEKPIEEPTLEDLVKKENPGYIICHRLDRNTAGLIIFAKNDISYNAILCGFKNNNITKEYIAYVAYSSFKNNEDTLVQYISTDKINGKSKIFNLNDNIKENNVKKITTSYKVIYTNTKDDFSILKIFIHNGKTHQIRAVLSNLGHPIIGDSKYGKNGINKKFNKSRQLLFAVSYNFNFEENSHLCYLNKKNISLADNYYMNYIGDIYEKVTES